MSGIGALLGRHDLDRDESRPPPPPSGVRRNDRGDQPGRVYDVGAVPMAPTPSP